MTDEPKVQPTRKVRVQCADPDGHVYVIPATTTYGLSVDEALTSAKEYVLDNYTLQAFDEAGEMREAYL